MFPALETSMKHFKAIAAMSLNRVIGNGQKIPWHLPEDFRWFKKMTTGNTIVMGRKTFESIGRPLPDRTTIIISRAGFSYPGLQTITSLEELRPETLAGDVFICGGAQIYSQALPWCSDLYLTLVKRTVDGDAFFPHFEHQFEPVAVITDTAEFSITHYRNTTIAA
jgi:dihydrofolate reductase